MDTIHIPIIPHSARPDDTDKRLILAKRERDLAAVERRND
jgi:hypothetical protein